MLDGGAFKGIISLWNMVIYMNNKEEQIKVYVMIGTIVMLLVIFSGITYAFFSASNNKGSTSIVEAKSGKMTISSADGKSSLLVSKDIQPSSKIIIDKTFTLTGTNTTSGLTMPYKVGIKYTSGFSYGQLHYYLKRTSVNSNITSNLIGTSSETIPGNTTETGYTSGTFIKNSTESYLELATGEFKANTSNQTITFNLKLQFPDTGMNQDNEKGKSFTGEIVVNYEDKLNNIAIGYDYLDPTETNIEPYYTFTAPKTGTYKIETWGAQGGGYSNNGGYGGYSTGYLNLQINSKIFIYIGGMGNMSNVADINGGYNGGGIGIHSSALSNRYFSSGGGATHIANTKGLLANLQNNISSILIVSGGGGGGYYDTISKINNKGGDGGGYIGNNGELTTTGYGTFGYGGSQSTPGYTICDATTCKKIQGWINIKHATGAFGIGGTSNINDSTNGGGGGFYGGGGSLHVQSAGGGSGYIGNSLLTNKAMYCYNCTESSEMSTKTISTTCHSENPTSNCAKEGNGYAKITLISN